MIKWDLKEKYEQQDLKYNAIRARYDNAVTEAGTRLADLKSEQAALLRSEFSTGSDLSAEKTKVRAKVTAAEKALEDAELERAQAREYARVASADGRITVRDLVLDYNGHYLGKIRDTEMKPIIDRMAAARDAYYNATLDYYDLLASYSPQYTDLRDLAYENNKSRPGDHMYPHDIGQASKLPQVKHEDLVYIDDRRKLPDGIQRTVNGGENK